MLNNWRRGQERMDLWVVRFSPKQKHRYWGLAYMKKSEVDAILRSVQVRLRA